MFVTELQDDNSCLCSFLCYANSQDGRNAVSDVLRPGNRFSDSLYAGGSDGRKKPEFVIRSPSWIRAASSGPG